MKKRIVGGVPGNVLGMLADLTHKLQHGARTPEQLGKFLKGENPFEGLSYALIFSEWEKYFWKIHQLKTDFSGVTIPEVDDDDFPWFVYVPENFSTERAFSGGKKLYPKWKWTNKSLNDILDFSFGRDAQTEPYIVRFHANWESDKDLKHLLVEDITERKINTNTLKERILLGDFLFWKHERHLDVEGATLCSGSRCSDGRVPRAYWAGDGFRVYSFSPDDGSYGLRAREVVSY